MKFSPESLRAEVGLEGTVPNHPEHSRQIALEAARDPRFKNLLDELLREVNLTEEELAKEAGCS
jgi:hypothetical protein